MKEGMPVFHLPSLIFETPVGTRGRVPVYHHVPDDKRFPILYGDAGGFQRCHVGVERSVSSGDVGVLAPARRFQDRFGATHISGRDGVV